MWTNAYGATSSSTTIAARGSRRRFRPLTESPHVVNTNSSPSSANHTGITCGCPLGPLVATLAVRVPWLRKARISSGVILRGIDGLLPDRRPNRLAIPFDHSRPADVDREQASGHQRAPRDRTEGPEPRRGGAARSPGNDRRILEMAAPRRRPAWPSAGASSRGRRPRL